MLIVRQFTVKHALNQILIHRRSIFIAQDRDERQAMRQSIGMPSPA
jgi:hypothetical protein